MFNNIGALAIYVTDIERAKKFYNEILGFTIRVQVHPQLCFLKSKSGDIDIYLEGGNKQISLDAKTCRLSFFLDTEGSVFETFEDLRSAGVTLLQNTPEQVGDDTYVFQFKDPDGNIIEVSGKS